MPAKAGLEKVMNTVILTGNLTKDIELAMTKTGKTVAQFNIGVRRDANTSDFPTCVAWGKTAELLKKYCHKGSKIGVTGSVQTSKYENDGKTIYKTIVSVSSVEFLGGGTNNKPNEETAQNVPEMDDNAYMGIDANDLPF